MQKNFPAPSLKRLEDFELYLPAVCESDNNQLPDKKKCELIKAEVVTTDQIISWTDNSQEKLRNELENLIPVVFSKMSEKDWRGFIDKFFKQRINKIQRQVILFRKEGNELIAASAFDFGEVEYEGRTVKAIYIILRAILDEYQGFGLGQFISSKILTELQPDILMVNCYQSSSLHSWVGLPKKELITGFDVYPRMEQTEGRDVLISLPFKDMDYIICVFKQMFPYDEARREKIMKNFTILMARKNDHDGVYNFNPWEKNGRKDKIAEALGLTDKDGVLVTFKKKIIER